MCIRFSHDEAHFSFNCGSQKFNIIESGTIQLNMKNGFAHKHKNSIKGLNERRLAPE